MGTVISLRLADLGGIEPSLPAFHAARLSEFSTFHALMSFPNDLAKMFAAEAVKLSGWRGDLKIILIAVGKKSIDQVFSYRPRLVRFLELSFLQSSGLSSTN